MTTVSCNFDSDSEKETSQSTDGVSETGKIIRGLPKILFTEDMGIAILGGMITEYLAIKGASKAGGKLAGSVAGYVWALLEVGGILADILDTYGYNKAMTKETIDDMRINMIKKNLDDFWKNEKYVANLTKSIKCKMGKLSDNPKINIDKIIKIFNKITKNSD